MNSSDKKDFGLLLTKLFAAYGKPLPEGALFSAWWDELSPFHAQVVRMAFDVYRDEDPKFAPNPNAIRKICREHDGRPGAEEAWAIALTSRDEADTVVWTAEAAEAFSLCQPVLNMGDEVGARMAFKEAYQRIVAKARGDRVPAQWIESLGWDVAKRTAVLAKASNAGLLAAPTVAALLPAPIGEAPTDENARSQINKIREMMARMNEEKQRESDQHIEREWKETEEFKRRTAEQVQEYLKPRKL